MMKLLLDQGLPRSAATSLRESAIDAVHVGDVGAATATDTAILQMARNEGRVVVTLDADFHLLLAHSGARLPSVIRVRIEGLRSEALARLLLQVLGRCSDELVNGAVVSVQEGRLRVRLLPLVV